jgi:aminopeptidase C
MNSILYTEVKENTSVSLNLIAGDCWLVAAIESLRHEVNRESFVEVVRPCGNALEFRWGVKSHSNFVKVKKKSKAIPVTGRGGL